MTGENCGTCRFSDNRTMPGECHRFPPQATIEADFIFPAVNADDWCGEWKPKPKPDEARSK